MKKTIKIKDSTDNTELEMDEREVGFGAPDYDEYEKKMKKHKETQEPVVEAEFTDVKPEQRLMSADDIIEKELDEKRRNKEQALLAYFQRVNLYRFHKEEQEQFTQTFEASLNPEFVAPINPVTGLVYNTALLRLKCQELHMALRIEARRIDTEKVNLLKNFGLDDKGLEKEFDKWFM